MEALLLVAEHDGPTMMARIGVMRALRRQEPKATPMPRRKYGKAYRMGFQLKVTLRRGQRARLARARKPEER